MIDNLKKSISWAFAIISVIFTFVPESFFESIGLVSQAYLDTHKHLSWLAARDVNIVTSRLICFGLIWILASFLYAGRQKFRRHITVKGQNYSIRVEYGDILKQKDCKRVINFDECYTDQVGNATADINPNSICGQYLNANQNLDIQQLIKDANVNPEPDGSKYQQKTRYRPGTIVPNGDDLLLAFARLDERGKGRFFSRDEYLACLDLLWKELEYHHSQKDVCVPILGAGATSFDGGSGASISQQDLLDMMIWSYRLSSHKIKSPHKLRIICRKNGDFSINDIDR